jgi:hypothetical protein
MRRLTNIFGGSKVCTPTLLFVEEQRILLGLRSYAQVKICVGV